MNLPVNSKRFFKVLCYAACIELFVFVWLLASDTAYFGYVGRHTATEIFDFYTSPTMMLSIVINDYLIYALVVLGLLPVMLISAAKFVNRFYYSNSKTYLYYGIKLFFIIALSIIAIRGKLNITSQKAITAIDAYHTGNIDMGNITLNGVFSMYTGVRHGKKYKTADLMEERKAIEIVRNCLAEDDEEFVSQDYPLLRKRKRFSRNLRGYNIAFIVLESWRRDYVDSFGGNNYGATPNFDYIAQNGIRFANFYAAGQRSIHGISAILSSITEIQGVPFLTRGMEVSNLPNICDMMKKIGYSNLFVQSDTVNSQRINSIAKLFGFDKTWGEEDIPDHTIINYTRYCHHDYEALMFFADKIKELKKPFFSLFFSGTGHAPFKKFTDDIKKFPDSGRLNSVLNTFYYVDYSLGKLMEKAKKDGWFDNTIFFILADHSFEHLDYAPDSWEKKSMEEKFHIPMVMYAPRIFKPGTIDFVVSQSDVFPSIIDIMNIKQPYTAYGKSFFADYKNRFAFASHNGSMLSYITKDGIITHDGKRVVNCVNFTGIFDRQDAAEKLQALNSAACYLLRKNKWYKD